MLRYFRLISIVYLGLGWMLGLTIMPKSQANPQGAGHLIEVQKLEKWSWSVRALNLAKAQMKLAPADYPTRSRVEFYRLVYETLSPKNQRVRASGLVLVPSDLQETMPLLSYQHATRFHPREAPSVQRFDPESHANAIFFASEGYLILMPDYLGLGTSAESPQYYLNAEIQATTLADFLKAAKTFLNDKKINYFSEIFIAGYSQGAHNSLALQRHLQEKEPNLFKTKAISVMAGPYGLTELSKSLLSFQSKIHIDPAFVALAILGMHEAYDFFPRFEEILAEPYSKTLPDILKQGNFRDISRLLPRDAKKLFNLPFVAHMIFSGNDHPFWRALALNDVDNFAPNAPLLMVHSPTDNVVPFQSMELASSKMKALGADIRLEILEDKWVDHMDAAIPAFQKTHQFFKEIRRK